VVVIRSFFLMQLLNKKYALPHRVIDAVANHFAAFGEEELALPVIWHQALLTFVQRYKQDITVADKTRLKAVMKMQFHYLVTPEIRREIGMGLSRGEKASETAGMAIDPMSLGTAVHENPKHMPPVVMDEML
jgi:essential nuclear protein 1